MRSIKRALSLFLVLSLTLSACGGGGGASAAAMRLRKTEGTVRVSDDKGTDLEVQEDLSLYSGCDLRTREESYAWIDLDEEKQVKMDQNTRIEIEKDGKDLEITVKQGSLFFHVTEPEDETMTIRTSGMEAGIRGTCGWVEVPEDEGIMRVYLLEGKASCSADGEKETVLAGEMATMTEDGDITVEEFSAYAIPAFVREELAGDEDLAESILDASGLDVSEPDPDGSGYDPALDAQWQSAYIAVLDAARAQNTGSESGIFGAGVFTDGDATYYCLYDIDKDGIPELFVHYGTSEAASREKIYTFLNGETVLLTEDPNDPEMSYLFSSHTGFYTYPAGNGVVESWGHMGGYSASILRLENGRLTGGEILYDRYMENYEDDFPTVGDYVPGTLPIEYFRIAVNAPITTYRTAQQFIQGGRPAASGGDSAGARQAITDVILKDGMLHASVADTVGTPIGDVSFETFRGPGGAGRYNRSSMTLGTHAWIDLNGDGREECVLRLEYAAEDRAYGESICVIFSYQDGEVYAYVWSYGPDTFMTDGTALKAYGNGACRVLFDKEDCYVYSVHPTGAPEAAWELF